MEFSLLGHGLLGTYDSFSLLAPRWKGNVYSIPVPSLYLEADNLSDFTDSQLQEKFCLRMNYT